MAGLSKTSRVQTVTRTKKYSLKELLKHDVELRKFFLFLKESGLRQKAHEVLTQAVLYQNPKVH